MNEEQIEIVRRLIDSDMSVLAIAQTMGMSYRLLQLQLARAGYEIQCRPRTERKLVALPVVPPAGDH